MQAFADIVRRPRWWIRMIIVGIVGAVEVGYSRSTSTGTRSSARVLNKAIKHDARAAPADGRPTPASPASLPGYVAPIGVAFTIVLIAAMMILLTNVMMGADVRFPSTVGSSAIAGFRRPSLRPRLHPRADDFEDAVSASARAAGSPRDHRLRRLTRPRRWGQAGATSFGSGGRSGSVNSGYLFLLNFHFLSLA